MKTKFNTPNTSELSFDLAKLGNPSEIAFVDIETTGLSREDCFIYMIGVAYQDSDKTMVIKQWLSESANEEKNLLMEFTNFITYYKTLVHFNGNAFDLPFIEARCNANGIDFSFSDFEGLDIYRRVSSLKHFLKLDNCKQKSIEKYLGINRDDEFTGKELIKVYNKFCETKDIESEDTLFLHNHDDVLGMLEILPILNYYDIFYNDIMVKKVQTNIYNDVNGMQKKELIITIALPSAIPVPINYNINGCYFSAKDSSAIIKVPMYHEELKYFYADYKDYYYLPEEDMAIHKSVAEYVDKDFREQAKAETCYTRKVSDFLPEWEPDFVPFFKREYKSQCMFFELTNEMKADREAFKKYTNHLLKMMYNCK